MAVIHCAAGDAEEDDEEGEGEEVRVCLTIADYVQFWHCMAGGWRRWGGETGVQELFVL